MADTDAKKLKYELSLVTDKVGRKHFLKFVGNLGEKASTTLRFFEQNEFFFCVGIEDCEQVSSIVFKSTVYIQKLDTGTQDPLPYLVLSKAKFEIAARELLLVKNFRVEVYVKKEENTWKLEYRGSPGNLLQFEDLLFANKEILVTNSILSLRLKNAQQNVGIAYLEQNTCQFQILEFSDDDFFTELEAVIVLLGPKECLIPTLNDQYSKVSEVLERNGVMVTVVEKSLIALDHSDLIQDLKYFLRFEKGQIQDASSLPETKLQLAMIALHTIIKYLHLANDMPTLGQYEINLINIKRFVHLDNSAITALNIFPKQAVQRSASSYHWQSILGVVDYCQTPQGIRLMSQWIRQPLRNLDILNDRHNIVEAFMNEPNTLNSLHDDLLKRIPDILLLTKKLLRKKSSLLDIFRLYQVILRVPKIIQILMELDNTTVTSVLCDILKNHINDLKGLGNMVEQVVDFEAIESGEYLVKPAFDRELELMNKQMTAYISKMERIQEEVADDLDLERKQVKLENVSGIGYHLRISLKDDSELRKNKAYNILHVVNRGVRFTTVKLAELSEKYSQLRSNYEEQQKCIVDEIINVAIGYSAPLTSLNYTIAQLDCLVSFAKAAHSARTPYIRPKMHKEGSGILNLKKIRHPCLENQEHVDFIANDIDFQKDKCNMLIITGPNMGGKSTYIRSVGTAVLLAHIGAFVPCSEAEISMVDSILGRVGASDNIEKGLSTFMVEMIETAGIIRVATENSLVIIDELGRGTSTYEGCGIAWSIAEHLVKNVKCFTLFATHFHEITNLSKTVSTAKNYHMEAMVNDDNFVLLYEIRPGPMTKSFGIQIAKLAQFPDAVLQDARRFYNEFDNEHSNNESKNDEQLRKLTMAALDELLISKKGEPCDINDTEKLLEKVRGFVKTD